MADEKTGHESLLLAALAGLLHDVGTFARRAGWPPRGCMTAASAGPTTACSSTPGARPCWSSWATCRTAPRRRS